MAMGKTFQVLRQRLGLKRYEEMSTTGRRHGSETDDEEALGYDDNH